MDSIALRTLTKSILPDGTSRSYNVPEGFTRTVEKPNITIAGTPDQIGDYQFVIQLTGIGGEKVTGTLVVHVTNATGITSHSIRQSCTSRKIVDDGRIVIVKNGVRYNSIGQKL